MLVTSLYKNGVLICAKINFMMPLLLKILRVAAVEYSSAICVAT